MMWVSRETIYQALFVQGRGELRRELARCLRTGRAKRRPRGRDGRSGHIKDMVMICERPAEADDRGRARPLGISMVLSSGGRELWRGCRAGPVVAQKCPQDVHAASGEGDDGLVVGAGVLALFR